jgi:hypothetical protein
LKNCAEVGPPRLSNITAAIANAISGTLPVKMPFFGLSDTLFNRTKIRPFC